MNKALEYSKDIVVAKISNSGLPISKDSGVSVADFFEQIYLRIRKLESNEKIDNQKS